MVAPLMANKKVLGVLYFHRIGQYFDNEDLTLAKTFAVFAATALKNAQNYDQILEEVSKRKQTEQALVREKNLSEMIINSLPGIFYMILHL